MGHLSQEQFDFLRNWQMSAYEGGLVGCDFPKEYGGGGRTGGQAGHKGSNRELIPVEEVDDIRHYYPDKCQDCGKSLLTLPAN